MPKFEREVDIDAPVEQVWNTITNPNTWGQWFPGIDSVTKLSAIEKNGQFEWLDGDRTGTGTIVEFEPNKRLKIVTQMGKDKDSHVFELKSTGGFLGLTADETKLTYILDTLMGGGIITNFIAGGNPKDTLRVKKAVISLRKLIES